MKILYVSKTRLNYSLNATYIKGLRENGVEVLCFKLPSRNIWGYIGVINFVRRNRSDVEVLVVGYDSSVLVPLLRPFFGGKMVYCSVLPVYERLITSRRLAGKWSLRGVYYWLIDFLAYRLSDLSMIESEQQVECISRSYRVSKNKLFKAWIGVDEDNFFYDSSNPKFPIFTVLFRGALMPESGAEYVVQAAKMLEKENIKFIMISGGMLLNKITGLIEKLKPSNLELKSDPLSYEDLRTIMQKCHLSIGQLSNHERLKRTVPHKVFESLVLKLPYLTAANSGILGLLKDGETCITCESANTRSLSDKILWVRNNYQEAERIAENGYQFYRNELQSSILAKKLLDKIQSLKN